MNNYIKFNNLYNNKELEFYNKLIKNESFDSSFVKFLIITSNNNLDRNIIYSFFDGLLVNYLCLDIESGYLIIYENKEHVEFNDYYDSMSFDLGDNFLLFDGFKVQSKNISYITNTLNLFYKYLYKFNEGCYNVKDIILKTNDSNEIKDLKLMVLDKYANDIYFIDFVNGLFDNDLNVSKTSQSLYMHRNTINNKLDSFCNDTGLKIQKFNDAISLYMLLKQD